MKILLAEDDAVLTAQVSRALREAGFALDLAPDGEEALHLGSTGAYDAAVLDLGLPKMDGLTVLRRWREARRSFPVLILTARDGWSDKVAGFRAGADDYLTKPFRPEEVVLRLRALMRRAAGHAAPVLECGPLCLDTATGEVLHHGLPLRLTAFEARILGYLLHHAGRPISRTELSEHVYDSEADRDFNTLEVLVSRLRRKIAPASIETLRGQGWRLSPGG
jgi:two-component system, OmpR family, response regulator